MRGLVPSPGLVFRPFLLALLVHDIRFAVALAIFGFGHFSSLRSISITVESRRCMPYQITSWIMFVTPNRITSTPSHHVMNTPTPPPNGSGCLLCCYVVVMLCWGAPARLLRPSLSLSRLVSSLFCSPPGWLRSYSRLSLALTLSYLFYRCLHG